MKRREPIRTAPAGPARRSSPGCYVARDAQHEPPSPVPRCDPEPAPRRPDATHAVGGWVPLATALAGFAVFRGALGLFFAHRMISPRLARASGVLPRLVGPWRYLSGQLLLRRDAPLSRLPRVALTTP
mgnify:CR=1 FL=1